MPKHVEPLRGHYTLKSGQIFADASATNTARFFADQLHSRAGLDFSLAPSAGSRAPISLKLKPGQPSGSYDLTIKPDSIAIEASDEAGLFYGVQTVLQLLPPGSSNHRLPCLRIHDEPRFQWRGMMLDTARHFFTKDEIKRLLDAMALYKLNTFHWHLVDDQGWRIEIKKYPKLTEMGAWRRSVGFGLDPKQTTAYGPDGRYGGFYTQDDIREVVAYAKSLHITVVPEIEMPGHASAALMAYPQFSCTGGPFTTDLPGGIFDGVFCVGNEESFKFVEGVLSEVFQLFPGEFVHVGGDEVLTNNWHNCAKCQALMKREGMHNDIELEGYFIRRVEKFINANNRRMIGWSEILHSGLTPRSAIMDWSGGAVEAATNGHDVVMSPLSDCYFDHYQSEDREKEPHARGGFLPLEQVYAFEPIPAGLSPEFHKRILGAQANLWTEYIPNFKHVEYMVFPRLCALAEVVWSPRESRNFENFSRRLQTHYKLFDQLGINYRHPEK